MTRAARLQDARVAIVGLGLMGGSFAAALVRSGACRRVVGIARRVEALDQALEMGAIDEGTCDLGEGVALADIVVLATPVRSIVRLVDDIGPLLAPGRFLERRRSLRSSRYASQERSRPPERGPRLSSCPRSGVCSRVRYN